MSNWEETKQNEKENTENKTNAIDPTNKKKVLPLLHTTDAKTEFVSTKNVSSSGKSTYAL